MKTLAPKPPYSISQSPEHSMKCPPITLIRLLSCNRYTLVFYTIVILLIFGCVAVIVFYPYLEKPDTKFDI